MTAPQEQAWTRRVVVRIDRFYSNFFGELGDAIEEHYLKEGFQFLASMESIKPFFSTLYWPKDGQLNATAKFIGGLLGHTVAHYDMMCHPKVWQFVCKGFNQLGELMLEKPGAFERLKENKNPFVNALPKFNSVMASVMRYPSRQSIAEQIQFYEGYTKALRRGSLTLNARGSGETTRTTAYQLIAVFGPILRLRCHSVHDVHRFLVRVLGQSRAGDIKRTEGICKTIHLRFKDSGRPSKFIQTPNSVDEYLVEDSPSLEALTGMGRHFNSSESSAPECDLPGVNCGCE